MPAVPSSQLFPEVVDASNIIAKPSAPIFLPIGVEGQADNDGTGVVNTPYTISTISEARTTFGVASLLTKVLEEVIKRGAFPVIAIASKKGSTPLLAERQATWDTLASDPNIRLRLTDSLVQADLVELGDSAEEASDLANNKQVAFGGMASGTTKAALITAAGAIASSRFVLVGPGIYDAGGAITNGSIAAAAVAAEVAKNEELSNDLDLWPLPFFLGIEKTGGLPVFRKKIVSSAVVNDFEDLLQAGISPLMPTADGSGVQTTHLRTTYTANTAFDALSTRLIADQVFVDIRDYVMTNGFLRRGNTEVTRGMLKAAVIALLFERIAWIAPVKQADGLEGYNVQVTPSSDFRQVTISYEGKIVRGIQTVQVSGSLEIAV